MRTILLLISHSCNLNCRYCYEKHKDNRKMSVEQAIHILEQEFNNSPEEIEIVNLLGGEPLSNFKIIPDICNWIWEREKNMQIFIRTNGTMLDNTMKEWFASRNKNIGLGLSIDGTPYVTLYNRGAINIDLDYFRRYWPEVPLKMTIFPDTVSHLYKSIKYLHNIGFNLTGGLAQGVKWDEVSVKELDKQLSKVADFYISSPEYSIISPLLTTDFSHYGEMYHPQKVCWERNVVHTYDCDNKLLPCHMFSSISQGKQKQELMLREIADGCDILEDNDCKNCSIRWMCTNCPGMNFQHYGNFYTNVNKRYLCECRKICAKWSAHIYINRINQGYIHINDDNLESIHNAVELYKEYSKL